MGRKRYAGIHALTITADCGDSNGARVKLWKVELQKLADEENITIHVHHYPPGTSKWNKSEQFTHLRTGLPAKNKQSLFTVYPMPLTWG